MRYKVVEVSLVVDDVIEGELNKWCNQGWQFDDIRFVSQDGVRRPTFAFLFFTHDGEPTTADAEPIQVPPVERTDGNEDSEA